MELFALKNTTPLAGERAAELAARLPENYRRRKDDGALRCHTLLRYVLSSRFDASEQAVKYDSLGKPFLPGSSLHISMSHTGGAVLCAVGEAPVGVDVQAYRTLPDSLLRLLTEDEFSGLDAKEKISLWTLKESFVKLLGGGIEKMKQCRFSLEGSAVCLQPEGIYCRVYEDIFGCAAAACSYEPLPPCIEIVQEEKILEL